MVKEAKRTSAATRGVPNMSYLIAFTADGAGEVEFTHPRKVKHPRVVASSELVGAARENGWTKAQLIEASIRETYPAASDVKFHDREANELWLTPEDETYVGAYSLDGGSVEDLVTGEIRPCDQELSCTITRELVSKARALGWTGAQLMAEAIRLSVPGAHSIEVAGTEPPRAN
jgi:hypothetical protein